MTRVVLVGGLGEVHLHLALHLFENRILTNGAQFLEQLFAQQECDQIFRDMARNDAVAAARDIAAERAVAAGADPQTVSTIETEDMPIAYLPGNSLRVRVRVVGAVAASA